MTSHQPIVRAPQPPAREVERRTPNGFADRVVERRRVRAPATFDEMIGAHAAFVAARETARELATRAHHVLILGEAGTGKAMFARAMHAHRGGDAPFVSVTCDALTPRIDVPTSLASAFEAAAGGTLLLAHADALSPAAADVLRTLLAGGSTVRVIATRSGVGGRARALDDARIAAPFEGDGCQLVVPTLRERASDIPLLARHFLDEAAAELGRPALSAAPAVIGILARYHWPENVRELRALVRRLAANSIGGAITIGQLPSMLFAPPQETERVVPPATSKDGGPA